MSKSVEELRTWLRRRLGAGEGFDVLWKQLEQEHYIKEFDMGTMDGEEILHKAREKLAAARELVYAYGGGQASTPRMLRKDEKASEPAERYFEPDLSDYERQRARAFEEVQAREAALSQGPDGSLPIIEWRRRFFGERLLSLEEAHGLIESPAARYLPLALFRKWDVPLIGHEAEVKEYDSGAAKPYIGHRATIAIDPPGVVKTVYYADPEKAGFDPEILDGYWYFSRDEKGNDGISPEERLLRYKDRDSLKETMRVWPGSVLDSLRSMSARWARMLGWDEENMTMWLLTGEPFEWAPLKAKLSYKTGRPLTVSLTVHPWVPAETVARNYRTIQHLLFGKDNRPLRPKSLAVLRFVEKRTREAGGKRPSWSRLIAEWNGQHRAEWHYTDRRNFSRDYRRALNTVAHSSFLVPKHRVSPAAKRKATRLGAEARERAERVLRNLMTNDVRKK